MLKIFHEIVFEWECWFSPSVMVRYDDDLAWEFVRMWWCPNLIAWKDHTRGQVLKTQLSWLSFLCRRWEREEEEDQNWLDGIFVKLQMLLTLPIFRLWFLIQNSRFLDGFWLEVKVVRCEIMLDDCHQEEWMLYLLRVLYLLDTSIYTFALKSPTQHVTQ